MALYGDLLDIFAKYEDDPNIAEMIFCTIKELYPRIEISRPSRVLDSVRRIVAPTRQSARGDAKIVGLSLETYRKKVWEPRIRTPAGGIEFPEELVQHGLTQEILCSTLDEVERNAHASSYAWVLRGLANIGFYRKLHIHLKRQPRTKVLIGKFYIAVDVNFREKESRPYNVYRFVETITASRRLSEEPMVYYNAQAVKQSMTSKIKQCSQQIEDLTSNCTTLSQQFKNSRKQLRTAQKVLHDVSKENESLKKKIQVSRQAVRTLKDKNYDLQAECISLQIDESFDSDSKNESDDEIDVQVGHHRRYPPEIRKLYYTLLADQVPVSKTASIIKAVLKCFTPSMNLEDLQLPQKSCASYMRKDELKTICEAHQAVVLASEDTKSRGISLNSDGTTKGQRKLDGVAANGMVLGVNEIPDGKAISTIQDISRQFEKLRRVAQKLGLPNPNSINWTLVVSSSSDSASTQKRVNKLIEEQRETDEAALILVQLHLKHSTLWKHFVPCT